VTATLVTALVIIKGASYSSGPEPKAVVVVVVVDNDDDDDLFIV